MSNKTTIITEPGSPILRVERVFNAAPEKVFAIFSQKDLVEKWWSPGGTAVVGALDFVEGGNWQFSTEDGSVTFHGFFHEITAPRRIVQTSEYDNLQEMIGDRGHTVLSKYDFTKVEGGTKVTLIEVYMSAEDLAMAIENNMETGLAASYRSIDAVLAGEK